MLRHIIRIAQAAGIEIMRHYKNVQPIRFKEDRSPLTIADLEANRLILRGLKKITPDIPIISEESSLPPYSKRRKWQRFWLVDPLDGTKEFVRQNGEFTVNICLIEAKKPIAGVIYIPASQRTYFGARNKGSFRTTGEGRVQKIFYRPPGRNTKINLTVSKSHDHLSNIPRALKRRVGKILSKGSSLKFCLLAEGRAHAYWRSSPSMEWDVAAGDCIYRYAARHGENPSSLTYNKKTLKNKGFLIGQW